MVPGSSAQGGGNTAALIVADGVGGYFAMTWEDLLAFRVPEQYNGVIEALVLGAEPATATADAGGNEDVKPAGGMSRLMAGAVVGAAPGRARLAARRLSAWALLR
jgi:hypothetical protein